MNYTIKHAKSHGIIFSFDKSGNKYRCSMTEVATWKTIGAWTFDRYEEADAHFTAICKPYNAVIETVEHDSFPSFD